MSNAVENLLSYVLPPMVTAIVGWFFGRRKSRAEATGTEIENVEKALAIYRGIITDMEGQIVRLKGRIEDLENQIIQLKNRTQCQE